MPQRTRKTIVALALALAGCDSRPMPTAPTPVVQPGSTQPGQGVSGTVHDTAYRALEGARVEVLDGPQAGQSATTDHLGRFTLQGTFDGTTRFRAMMEGYQPGTVRSNACSGCPSGRYLEVYLAPLAPPVDIAGEYTLSVIADGTCGLPEEARVLTYPATVHPYPDQAAPAGTQFQVTLDGAFLGNQRRFFIGVAGDDLGFWVDHPPIVAELAERTYLAIAVYGQARGTSGAFPVTALLDGTFEYCVTQSPLTSTYSCSAGQAVTKQNCASTTHRFVLARR